MDEDFTPISALQHFVFCKRRAALVHIERLWTENQATVEGNAMHERAHGEIFESRGDVRFRTTLPVRSRILGIVGVTDVVEFRRSSSGGVALDGASGLWTPYPVEYKRGSEHKEIAYEVQLCAQALCIEEMLSTQINWGAIYWGGSHKRQEIEFSQSLRAYTEQKVRELQAFLNEGKTPPPHYEKKCKGCSMLDVCMPKELEKKIDVSGYWESFFKEVDGVV